jgi:hypothetical protein
MTRTQFIIDLEIQSFLAGVFLVIGALIDKKLGTHEAGID